MSEENQGSFLNGFSMGLFAGAAGYFLFGTNKGSDIRKQLATEWEKAKEELEEKGVIEEGKGIREIITSAVNKISENQKSKSAVSKSKTKPKTKASKKKFKGV